MTRYWMPAGSALMVAHLYHGIGYTQVSGVSVQRTATQFPIPMTLAYVFDHWVHVNSGGGKQNIYAQLGVEIRINGVMTPLDHIDVPLSVTHRFCLPFMNGALAFTPVDVKGEPVELPAAFAMPAADMDAYFTRIEDHHARVEIVRPPQGLAPLRLWNSPVPDACGAGAIPAPPAFAPSAPAAP